MHLNRLLAAVCFLSVSAFAQDQQPPAAPTPAQTPPQTVPTSVPPVEAQRAGETSDGHTSLLIYYWNSVKPPVMRTGAAHVKDADSTLDFPGKKANIPAVEFSIPAGKDNSLRFSYFRGYGAKGNTTASRDLFFFDTTFDAGETFQSRYTVQNVKVSLDYTSWPFPIGAHRFRFKTLWEVQYFSIQTKLSNAGKSTKGTDSFITPTLGIGAEYILSKNVRWEAKGSGFGFPHRWGVGDGTTFLAVKAGNIEIVGGAKAFYFRTSSRREEYVKGTLAGAFVGLRWYP